MSGLSAKHRLIDAPTLVVALVMTIGFPLTGWLLRAGHISWPVAVLAGTWLMNLSFTAWHESSHANFSSKGWLNDVVGIVTSFASVYPGYFARRREHLVHHRYEGIEGKDPVYPRIQTTFWRFPFRLLKLMIERPKLDVPDGFLKITPAQRASDLVSNALVLAVCIACARLGLGRELLAVWIAPRILVFLIHAYYICFFPHGMPGGGYKLLRVRPGALLWLATMGQNYHGVHHRWPFIPWHRYHRVAKSRREELLRSGVELL